MPEENTAILFKMIELFLITLMGTIILQSLICILAKTVWVHALLILLIKSLELLCRFPIMVLGVLVKLITATKNGKPYYYNLQACIFTTILASPHCDLVRGLFVDDNVSLISYTSVSPL